MSVGTAPGKVILLGEHAVVYGSPAMAVPVSSVRARVEVSELGPHDPSVIQALDLDRTIPIGRLPSLSTDDGLVAAYHSSGSCGHHQSRGCPLWRIGLAGRTLGSCL